MRESPWIREEEAGAESDSDLRGARITSCVGILKEIWHESENGFVDLAEGRCRVNADAEIFARSESRVTPDGGRAWKRQLIYRACIGKLFERLHPRILDEEVLDLLLRRRIVAQILDRWAPIGRFGGLACGELLGQE